MTGLVQAVDRIGAGNERHGPLPLILLGLTVLTGMVDAVSYLRLGHVFVANMTGNVIFLGFAAGGAREFSVIASLVALAAFFVGAFSVGKIGGSVGAHRGHLIAAAIAIETILVAAALTLSLVIPDAETGAARYGLITLLSLAMGVQNAIVRRLAVPDLTTTVLTLTFTGLAADGFFSTGPAASRLRRLTAIL
ncbi:MAG: YoaK family protein, partial [Dongiaceae bacterium]